MLLAEAELRSQLLLNTPTNHHVTHGTLASLNNLLHGEGPFPQPKL